MGTVCAIDGFVFVTIKRTLTGFLNATDSSNESKMAVCSPTQVENLPYNSFSGRNGPIRSLVNVV